VAVIPITPEDRFIHNLRAAGQDVAHGVGPSRAKEAVDHWGKWEAYPTRHCRRHPFPPSLCLAISHRKNQHYEETRSQQNSGGCPTERWPNAHGNGVPGPTEHTTRQIRLPVEANAGVLLTRGSPTQPGQAHTCADLAAHYGTSRPRGRSCQPSHC
jgi:hypothetical protein